MVFTEYMYYYFLKILKNQRKFFLINRKDIACADPEVRLELVIIGYLTFNSLEVIKYLPKSGKTVEKKSAQTSPGSGQLFQQIWLYFFISQFILAMQLGYHRWMVLTACFWNSWNGVWIRHSYYIF